MTAEKLMVLSRGWSVKTGIAYARVGLLVNIEGKSWERKELGYGEVRATTLYDSEAALVQAEKAAFLEARKKR
jgi:hypothetical protein